MTDLRFIHDALSPRVVFGAGSLTGLPDELERLGLRRAVVIATSGRAELVRQIQSMLGNRSAGQYLNAKVHVPAEVAREAEALVADVTADSLVAVGGGSAIGVAKAVALATSLPIIAIPTTYSGSEMTPVWGMSDEGAKKTGRDPRVLPRVVVYDPELTVDLPARTSAVSGLNAMAHCVEAMYAPDATPFTTMTAVLSLQLLPPALRGIARAPQNIASRTDAMYAGMLAGSALANVQMGIHHKLCHALGGSFGLPHAETHAVMLPHSAAYNRDAAITEMTLIAASIDADDAAQGLYDLALELGSPMSLAELGMREDDLDRAAELATEKPYPNPRPVTREGVRELLRNAFNGERPE